MNEKSTLAIKSSMIVALTVLLMSVSSKGGEPEEIINYRQYDETLASSGQPTAEQLKLVATSGTERVIYLAYTDNETAIEDEDRTVMNLGMAYIHIPIDFMKPTLEDFQHFAAIMQASPDKKTLVHCQINLRASAFSFLYRVIFLKTPLKEATDAIQGVWAPNEVWFDFIETVSEHYGVNLDCDGCDWGAHEMK